MSEEKEDSNNIAAEDAENLNFGQVPGLILTLREALYCSLSYPSSCWKTTGGG